jgi:hypothetical protein
MTAPDTAKPAAALGRGAIAHTHFESIVQRDDGKWSIGWQDDAPGPFESRRFAEAVSEVRTNAPA